MFFYSFYLYLSLSRSSNFVYHLFTQNDFAFFHQLHEELFGSKEALIDKLWDIPMLTVEAGIPKEKLFRIIDDYLHNTYNQGDQDKSFRKYS